MARHRIWMAAAALVLSALPAWAGAPAPPDDAQRLADKIDEYIGAGLARHNVRPAPPAPDDVYLRRLSLDIAGKIPTVTDARRYLADRTSGKQRRAIDRLLDSPGYVNHFTNIWRDLLLPEANADFQRQYYLVPNIENWLRQRFADNVPYDQMVRELVTAQVGRNRNLFSDLQPALNGNGGDGSPLAYFVSKDGKPENLAASTARLFLGVRIECAQCHDHPFGRWTREQFWGQAAFFAGIRGPRNANEFFMQLSETADRRELAIPNTERVAQAKFLDGTEPKWKFKTNPRTTLADWMTAPDNPFFARAAVNRLWAQFFGIGIVDPVDDFNDVNKPSHPELLDELARQFVAHKYDFKFIIRAITLSKAYQLSSVYPGPSRPDKRLFARMPVKGLTSEQLFESVVEATGYRDFEKRSPNRFFNNGPRRQFLEKFASQDKPTEFRTAIPQALALMNSPFIGNLTNPQNGEVIVAVANSPFMDDKGKIEALFLAALSRKPRPEEAAKFLRYVKKGGAAGDKKKALSDVFWALLNSSEFMFNH